jgi:hypothetical protein
MSGPCLRHKNHHMESLNSKISNHTRLDIALATLLGLTSLALYVRTLAPGFLYGDSAEFQTIVFTSGIGHPTGYPIYILLAKLSTFIPFGDFAWRVNLFSAICAAVTVVLVYLLIRKIGAKAVPALYGSLALALSPLFWKNATIAEIYTPSVMCLVLVFYTIIHWWETKHHYWLFFSGLLGGLSLGIHATVALSGVAILLFLILSTRQRDAWISAFLGALIGVVVFLCSFLLLDSLNSPAGYYNTVVRPSLSVWGMTPADFDSPFERLAFLYFPPQFSGQFFGVPFDKVLARLIDFAKEASWSLLLALPGFISLFIPRKNSTHRWREAILLIVAFAGFLTFAATYHVYDFYVYYIPVIVVLVIFISLGVNAIIELVDLMPNLPRLVPIGLSIVILIIGFFPSVDDVTSYWKECTPPMLENWEGNYYKNPEIHQREIETVVNAIEDNAIVFTDWDELYGFYYVAYLLQGRTGMSFHETYPQEGVKQLASSAIEYIEANIDSHPIYFSEKPFSLAARFTITRTNLGLFQIE